MKGNLRVIKGFRNIVVHRYGAIDDALAFRLGSCLVMMDEQHF